QPPATASPVGMAQAGHEDPGARGNAGPGSRTDQGRPSVPMDWACPELLDPDLCCSAPFVQGPEGSGFASSALSGQPDNASLGNPRIPLDSPLLHKTQPALLAQLARGTRIRHSASARGYSRGMLGSVCG